MVEVGYTMVCEQRAEGPRPRRAGFGFSVISDHHPWLEARGHAGYAWSIFGAAANATERIPPMT